MKRLATLFSLVLSCCLLSACPSPPPPSLPEPLYERDAIHLDLKADPKLNWFQERPHHLSICLYQLRDPNWLNQLSADDQGLYKLLECDRHSDPSAAIATRLEVQPGQRLQQSLDRAAGALYVGLVAGYYTLERDDIVRLYKVPVIVEKKGFFKRKVVSKLGHLTIELMLGPQELLEGGREQ